MRTKLIYYLTYIELASFCTGTSRFFDNFIDNNRFNAKTLRTCRSTQFHNRALSSPPNIKYQNNEHRLFNVIKILTCQVQTVTTKQFGLKKVDKRTSKCFLLTTLLATCWCILRTIWMSMYWIWSTLNIKRYDAAPETLSQASTMKTNRGTALITPGPPDVLTLRLTVPSSPWSPEKLILGIFWNLAQSPSFSQNLEAKFRLFDALKPKEQCFQITTLIIHKFYTFPGIFKTFCPSNNHFTPRNRRISVCFH